MKYSAPLHGQTVAKAGQPAIGWRITITSSLVKVTLYVICAP